jgi:CRISPR/Cas system type I-B associated protein Csh2 (Cas7 group RAMP superfamily)
MTDEQLEAKIRDRGIGIGDDTITVRINATERREDDFNAIRDAVREILDND